MKNEMTFLQHLSELRKRVIHSLGGIFVGFCVSYSFSKEIFDFLIQPLCKTFQNLSCKLVYLEIAEPFLVYLKVGLVGGIFLAIPWIFFQLWKFISPGLKPKERKWIIPFVGSASLFFILGAALGYFYIFPFAFEFFLNVAPIAIEPNLSMASYFSFTSGLLFAFGILFELPLLVILLNGLGLLSASTLWSTWRYAVVIIFIVSALLTPADPYTLLLLGIPLTLLYFSSLIVCSLLEQMRRKII